MAPSDGFFGPYLHLKDGLCTAEKVVVGTIGTVTPYIPKDGAFAGFIWSTLEFDVERVVRGTNDARFEVDVPGGTLNGETTSAAPAPEPKPGLRYLLFVKFRKPGSPAPGGWHYPPEGGPQLFYFSALEKSAVLPKAEALASEFEGHCAAP